jgi:biotin operon repressor
VIEFSLTAHDLSHTRLAFSPLWETVASLRVLQNPDHHRLHQPWLAAVEPKLTASGIDVASLFALVPARGYVPDFLTPPPSVPLPDVRSELARLRSTDPNQVCQEVNRLRGGASAEVLHQLYADPEVGLAALGDLLESYWEVAIAPYWSRLRTVLEGDIQHRARRIAAGGITEMFTDLHHRIRWDAGVLTVDLAVTGRVSPAGRGVVLVPCGFISPSVVAVIHPPWQPALVYPPIGVSTLWQSSTGGTAGALAGLIGRTRARLLSEATTPTSTSELARRSGVSLGAVSQHLGALRSAGLIVSHRTGRTVLHVRTPLAEDLLAGCA